MFKKVVGVCLLAAMLCGCTQQTPTAATTPTEPVFVTEETTVETEPAVRGLMLQAAGDVIVTLYSGFHDGEIIAPSEIKVENDLTCYYYYDIAGSYRYTATGVDYYSITKNIYISDAEAESLSVFDVTPAKRAGTGWEAGKVLMFGDEYIANFPSDPSLWPDYQEAFQTPEFTTESAEHQHTTQEEMETFISQLDEKTDYMYSYSMGVTGYGNNMPLVVFTKTDLSAANTIEEVADLVNANGKLTIHYQGQMHGNEPAGGEGVLAMMLKLCGDYGEEILDTVNIYCIPRLNPDGAEKNQRTSPVGGRDMNGDFLLAQTSEVQDLHKVTKLFRPTVMIDSHEYTAEPDRDAESWKDLLISPGFNPTSGQEFVELGISMTQNAFETASKQGLTYNYYTGLVNSKSAYVGRNYAALKGTLFFLIESRGINFGNQLYERRTVGHLITATSLIDYVVANAEMVRSVVNAEKQRIIDTGKTYEETDVLVLKSSATRHPELDIPIIRYDTATGEGHESSIEISVIDQIDRSRPAPTAYVIPAGEDWNDRVLYLMKLHGISYSFVPAGSSIKLQGYTGNTTEAALTDEQTVRFPKGAYVFTMAQENAKVLAMLMEPDVTDVSDCSSTLAMAGIIPATETGFPIYRYIRNLNSDGSVTVY